MTEEEALGALVKNTVGLVHAEDLLVGAIRDLLREEVKRYIRDRLDERPALNQELKRGVAALMKAKVREASALVLMAKRPRSSESSSSRLTFARSHEGARGRPGTGYRHGPRGKVVRDRPAN